MQTMSYKHTLVTLTCLLLISCSSSAKSSFEKIVYKFDKYFSEKPTLITSNMIIKEGIKTYTYFGYKIDGYELNYEIKRTFSSRSPYSSFIEVSCNAFENAKGGDMFSDNAKFQTESGIISGEASGFSTTQMALANSDFFSESRWTINVGYTYQNGNWIYNSVTGGPPSHSFIHDLKTFPQNRGFRKAIGMEG